ncbi:MAG: putative nitrogen fixation protein NifT [Alphaproteobacteria bacterium]|nr:putative nitrogen fixation protein NifT [Alphaproteobacteria bacterium]
MKVMLRKHGEGIQAYVPKKDMEANVVEMEKPGMWGGWIKLTNDWVFELPDLALDTKLPITVEAKRLAGE